MKKNDKISFRCEKQELKRLAMFAKQRGVTMSEAIRLILNFSLETTRLSSDQRA